MVSEPVSKKFGTEKSLGTGLEKIWYRKKSRNRSRKKLVPKKVSEPVSKKFGTEKKSRNRSRKNLVQRKSLGTGLVQILGLVTHWLKRICAKITNLLDLRYNKLLIFNMALRDANTTKKKVITFEQGAVQVKLSIGFFFYHSIISIKKKKI